MNELNHLNLQKRLKDRFFRYIAIESQSQEGVNEVPSTPGQWTLARLLMRDLETLGLQGISINEHGVVQAHLPARLHETHKVVPSIGFVCYMDTVDVGLSPEIHPVLICDYHGGDICQIHPRHSHTELFYRRSQFLLNTSSMSNPAFASFSSVVLSTIPPAASVGPSVPSDPTEKTRLPGTFAR
jgi:hypothetical protein